MNIQSQKRRSFLRTVSFVFVHNIPLKDKLDHDTVKNQFLQIKQRLLLWRLTTRQWKPRTSFNFFKTNMNNIYINK